MKERDKLVDLVAGVDDRMLL